MIVLNKDVTMENKSEMDHKESLEDLFRKELDAYCAYKEWKEETSDSLLEMALEEIMMDEYLHAKFLRDYMIDRDMYTLTDSDPHEKKYWKIHRKIFYD
jgi:hypothetical protein